MKRLLILICFLILISPPAHAVQENVLYFPIADIGQAAKTNVRVTLTLEAPNPRIFNGIGIRQDPIWTNTLATGTAWFTNILWGRYRVDVAGVGTSFKIYVGTNTLGSVNGWSCYTNAAAVPPDDSTLYYTKAQVDSLIAGVGTGGGGSATNVFFTTGQSTQPRTVSGSNTFDVVGTLTNRTTGLAGGLSANASVTGAVLVASSAAPTFYTLAKTPDDALLFQLDNDAAPGWHFTGDTFVSGGALTADLIGTLSGTQIVYDGADTNLVVSSTGGSAIVAYSAANDGIVFPRSAGGNGQFLTNLPPTAIVGVVTNASIPVFSSISAMISAGVSNNIVEVVGYYGTNTYGGGRFRLRTGVTLATNLGTIFTNRANSTGTAGYRERISNFPTNVMFGEWFGLWPNNGDISVGLLDQSAILQAAVNATPRVNGKLILPEFGITITNSIVLSNWAGCYFGGDAGQVAPGFRYFPNNAAILHWNGPTNLPMIKLHDSGHTTLANFGLDTRVPTSNTAYWSNKATIMIDVDMPSGTTTTTADVFKGLMLRERGTNASLEGIRFAYSSVNNVEFMVIEDCQFTGTGANYPNYWISMTNVGALYAVRVGGGGGGANSFRHIMRNCNFVGWQNYVKCQSAGTWDIYDCKGTGAGVAAFDLSGVGPSKLIGYRGEGDRQSAVNSTTHQTLLEGNEFASSYSLSVSNIALVDAQNLVMVGNTFNTDASGYTPSVTNSFTSTGWYRGAHNRFASTNDALLPYAKFQSSFESVGDFGTLSDSARIQKFPLKTPSLTQATNAVVAKFTDGTSSTMSLAMMPGGGTFSIGALVSGAKFSVDDTASPGNPIVFQDAGQANRFKFVPGSTTSEVKVTSSAGSYFEAISTDSRVDLIAASGKNQLSYPKKYLEVVNSNSVVVMQFNENGSITFPSGSNVTVTGPLIGNTVSSTNFVGNGQNVTNLTFPANTITMADTNAAMLSNVVSYIDVRTNLLITNWNAMAVNGVWGRSILTNGLDGTYWVNVPTNLLKAELTNRLNCFVQLSNTGTNWQCAFSNGATAELNWSFWGNNINSGHAYFLYWGRSR